MRDQRERERFEDVMDTVMTILATLERKIDEALAHSKPAQQVPTKDVV